MPPVHRIDVWELRKVFNAEILPRIEAGEVKEVILSENPASPAFGQPPGTLSQMVAYLEARDGRIRQLARAHRYLRPDGTLGGSGKRLPDPKEVLHEGKLLKPLLKKEAQPQKRAP
jgi:hypothetical protein